MRPIRWLHISDIHMRPRDEWSQNVALQAMHEDIERQRANSAIDFILVSGDLAYSGKAEEYVLVGQFFDDLATASGVQKDRIFCIPGNHDIDRDRQKLCFRGARIALRDPSTTDSFLASPIADDFVTLLERQESYRSFQSAYFGDQERIPTNDGLGYVTRLIIDGVRLAILGFDSAWLADGGVEDHLNLLLGERQVLNTIKAVRDGDDPPHIIAAMAHHPFHLLQDFDRRNVQMRIEDFCHFLHCGHLHNPEARPAGNSPLGCLTLAAGASFETRHTQNSYCVVTLDLLRGLRTLTINHYNGTEGAFSLASTHDYRIEIMPTSRCDMGELAATIAARTATPWPHYVAALLLASKSELPVPVFDGHTFASFEVIEAMTDSDLRHKTVDFLTFRNALLVLYGRELIEEIFHQHGDTVIAYCAALAELGAAQPSLRTRLDAQEQDALLLAAVKPRSSFSHTTALFLELADAHEWALLRQQAERHIDAADPTLMAQARRMLALALANSLDASDKAAAITLYRSLAESAAPDPTDAGNLAILLTETGAPDEAKAALLQGVATCPPERLDYLAGIGYTIIEATGDREFREQLRAAIAERGTR